MVRIVTDTTTTCLSTTQRLENDNIDNKWRKGFAGTPIDQSVEMHLVEYLFI